MKICLFHGFIRWWKWIMQVGNVRHLWNSSWIRRDWGKGKERWIEGKGGEQIHWIMVTAWSWVLSLTDNTRIASVSYPEARKCFSIHPPPPHTNQPLSHPHIFSFTPTRLTQTTLFLTQHTHSVRPTFEKSYSCRGKYSIYLSICLYVSICMCMFVCLCMCMCLRGYPVFLGFGWHFVLGVTKLAMEHKTQLALIASNSNDGSRWHLLDQPRPTSDPSSTHPGTPKHIGL